MVIEASLGDFFKGQVIGKGWTGLTISREIENGWLNFLLELLIFINDLDAIFKMLCRGLFADAGEVAVHDF